MQDRKKLLRGARLLKAAIIAYKLAVFDMDLLSVELQNGILWMKANKAKVSFGPFPEHLVTKVDHKEAVLTAEPCSTAMSLLGPLARRILAGNVCQWLHRDVMVLEPLVPTKVVGDEGNGFSQSHHLFKTYADQFGEEVFGGSQAEFEEKLRDFGEGLRAHMMGFYDI
ncbi:hypothetical protein ACHAQH_006770 [Verticillium albo-atrum]